MKDKIEHLITRIDAFNKRERTMLLGAIIVCIYVIWDSVLFHPLAEEKKRYTNETTLLNEQISILDTQINSIVRKYQIDPDKASKASLARLKKESGIVDEKLKAATLGLITPKQMSEVLEDVLVKTKRIKLVHMESIPAVSMIEQLGVGSVKPAPESVSAGIFRHGLLMEVEGSYLDTLSFLKALEELKWELYWDSIEFKTKKYPNSKVIIKVYTLSLDKEWIGV